ncbi:MAG: hypothetical protein ACR2MM_00085 [Flavobacteriaceae bacterium]
MILVFLILSGCKDLGKTEKPIDDLNAAQKNELCLSKEEREGLIKAILNTPDFQMFLHPDAEGRLPIRLVKNEFVTPDLNILSNDQRVIFEDSLFIPNGSVHRLRIVKKNCENKKFSYSIFYPIEGAFLFGDIMKSDTLWLIENTTWAEH